jgi:hypothetical protein
MSVWYIYLDACVVRDIACPCDMPLVRGSCVGTRVGCVSVDLGCLGKCNSKRAFHLFGTAPDVKSLFASSDTHRELAAGVGRFGWTGLRVNFAKGYATHSESRKENRYVRKPRFY